MTRTNEPGALQFLTEGLAEAKARLEPKVAAPASAQAAALTQAMNKTNDRVALQSLALRLSEMAARLEPDDAAQAAATLTHTMSRTNDPYALAVLARSLSNVASRMEARKAARASPEAAVTLLQAMARTNDPTPLTMLAQGLSALLGDGQRLDRVRAVAAAVGSLAESRGLPGVLALLRPAAEPLPRRLSDPELVELLERALCVGFARRVILDHLEQHHQRTFIDQWDFVRFAEEQKLGLDFTSRPLRPTPPNLSP
jgi:hypothetical protein